MADENVVSAPFGVNKHIQRVIKQTMSELLPKMNSSQLTREERERAHKDLSYIIQRREELVVLGKKVDAAITLIFKKMNFQTTNEKIAARRKDLSRHGLPDLCVLIQKSNEAMWRGQPEYFGAVLLEYHYRSLAALASVVPKD